MNMPHQELKMTDVLSYVTALLQDMEKFRQSINRSLSYAEGTHTLNDVVAMVLNGKLSFWSWDHSYMITEVIHYPQQRHLNVFLAGGSLEELKSNHEFLVTLAEQYNCEKITLSGRKGWARALLDIGWKPSHTTVCFDVKGLTYGQERWIGDDHGETS